jgi:tRNA(Leu) C34 or U34 (ribose-2'-O)-methylase TrmL
MDRHFLQWIDKHHQLLTLRICLVSYRYLGVQAWLFGPETRGLPQEILDRFEGITLPMQVGSRSLNLKSLSCRCRRCRSNNAGLMLVDLGVESEKR